MFLGPEKIEISSMIKQSFFSGALNFMFKIGSWFDQIFWIPYRNIKTSILIIP